MTATGAEAGSDLVRAGPATPPLAPTPPPGQQGAGVRSTSARPRKSLTRATGAAVLAVLAGFGTWQLLRNGIRTDFFPPFITGTVSTPITRYSGPWLTAAAGAALVMALSLVCAGVDLLRWSKGPQGERGGRVISPPT